MKTRLPIAIIALLMASGCGPHPMAIKAKGDAKDNPGICKDALKDTSVSKEGLDINSDSSMYRHTLYFTCLEQEALRHPEICSDVLAAGFPKSDPALTTNQNVYKLREYFACKNYASSALDSRNISLIKIDKGIYEGGTEGNSNVVIGRIASVQIENKSTTGTTGGAQVGASVGQIAYLDNTNLASGYSPWKQIGAGISGAAVGSSMDQPGQAKFNKTYWIKTNSGNFVSFVHRDIKSGHLPESMCVAIINNSDIQQAKEDLCDKKSKSKKE